MCFVFLESSRSLSSVCATHCLAIYLSYAPSDQAIYAALFRGEKGTQTQTLLVRISSGGARDFHVKGWGPKSLVCPPKPREAKLFGGISRDFAGISRGCPKSLRKKVSVQFSSPMSICYFNIHQYYLISSSLCLIRHIHPSIKCMAPFIDQAVQSHLRLSDPIYGSS